MTAVGISTAVIFSNGETNVKPDKNRHQELLEKSEKAVFEKKYY
jgi:hypothetical protein